MSQQRSLHNTGPGDFLHVPASRVFKKVSMPEFKDKQVPDFPRAVANPAAMLLYAPLNFDAVEIASLHALGFQQNLQEGCARPAAEPMHKGHGKALLFAVQNLVRHS